MKTFFPDYNSCLTNVTCSILKYFDISARHKTLPELDELMKPHYKNIVLILYDGMGSKLLARNLSATSFLNKHKIKDIHAVYPPTTTASTTSILSGLNPNEHGFLGWDMYYEEENVIASMFRNTIKDTNIPASSINLANKYYPYESIIDLINKKYEAYSILPFGTNPYHNLKDMTKRITKLCKKENKKFIYAYYEEPDHSMHDLGTDSKKVLKIFQKINEETEKLCQNLDDDTLVIVIADHGHLNAEYITLTDYSDIINMLEIKPWLEGRACVFKVKEGKALTFKNLFNKYFGEFFLLYSKEEVLKKEIFGPKENHQRFTKSLGDYLAIAISNKYFRYDEQGNDFKSTHAGITEDEVLVPLIVYHNKK